MQISTLGRMLEKADECIHGLENYLMNIRDTSADDRTRLLTYYLARHKTFLREVLQSFPPEFVEDIKRLKLRISEDDFRPDCAVEACCKGRVSREEVLAAVSELDSVLASLYEWLKGQVYPAASDVLELLQKKHESAMVDIAKIKEQLASECAPKGN